MDAVLMNNNPETVSTDFDTSDRLYFEPLTLEYVTEVLLREQAHGILLQFGDNAINLALPLEKRLPSLNLGLEILGTTCDAIMTAIGKDSKNSPKLIFKCQGELLVHRVMMSESS